MSILVNDGPGEPNPFERTPLAKAAEHKTEDGEQYPAEAFAYVPDPTMPSTWKLRLWSSPSEKATARQVGAAIAALGPGGFRGQPVDIPDEDRPKVVARVLAEWRKLHPGQEVPTTLMKAFGPISKHGSHDQSSHGRGKGGGGGAGSEKPKQPRPAPRPRDMQDAADYLADKDPVASGRYEGIGLSNMSAETANQMVDRAKKLGWKPAD